MLRKGDTRPAAGDASRKFRRQRGATHIALLIALSSMPCGSVARVAGKGCGSAGRTAARSADARVSAANMGRMRSGGNAMHGVGAGMGADDLARLGLDDALGGATRAADDAALTRIGEHSLDAIDLVDLALNPDEQLSASAVPEFTFEGPDNLRAVLDVSYFSTLSPAGDPMVTELFHTVRELRRVIDASEAKADRFASTLRLAPARSLVLMSPEFDDGGKDPGDVQIAMGRGSQGMVHRASVRDFARQCVTDKRACVVLGCPPEHEPRCALASLDLLLACDQRKNALVDCLRERGDADPQGPSVTVAMKQGTELRVLRSTRAP